MSIYEQVFLSLVVLGMLYFLSLQFNRYIDSRQDLFDGETAVWVMIGTFYTLVGYGFLVLLWWHEMACLPSAWQGAVTMFGLILLSFVASGIPMAVGDARRAHQRRMEAQGERFD